MIRTLVLQIWAAAWPLAAGLAGIVAVAAWLRRRKS